MEVLFVRDGGGGGEHFASSTFSRIFFDWRWCSFEGLLCWGSGMWFFATGWVFEGRSFYRGGRGVTDVEIAGDGQTVTTGGGSCGWCT